MECSKCGKEIDENDKFCTYCGNENKLEDEKEVKVGEENDFEIVEEKTKNKKNKDFFYYFNRIIIGIVVALVLILIIIFTVFEKMTSNNSVEEFENVANEEVSMTDQEVLDYVSQEVNKIFVETKESIFFSEKTDDSENEIAITGMTLGGVQVDTNTFSTFLGPELDSMGIVVALKDDKISDIQVNVVYSGQYYILVYVPGYGVSGSPSDLSKYLGQISYNVDTNNYSNVTFKSDVRYDATYGSKQYFSGDDSIIDVSGGYFKASMINGKFSDVEFYRGNRSIDVNNLNFDYQLKK